MKEILVGETAEVYTRVTSDKLAIAVGSGSLKVFSTPSMTALMEEAACAVLKPFLDENETSVGTALHIKHTASTPLGMHVSAEAKIIAVNGREIKFQVSVKDEIEEIGCGTHKRFVVNAEKFQMKTDTKGFMHHE